MSRIRFIQISHQILVAAFVVSLLFGCERLPNPKFSYLPRENTEAGDSIWFTNLSRASDQFSWNFGDGNNSNEENPKHLYASPGVYEVILTARNGEGEASFKELIPVNDPTVLGFIISDSTGAHRLKGAEIWIYADSKDLEKAYNPHFYGLTNKLGLVYFQNAEAKVYHVQVIRQDEKGRWAYRGFTSALQQNKVNQFTVPCIWTEEE